MTWRNIPEIPEEFVGFVYEIIEKNTNKKYIGIKKFWKIIKYPPLKGKKNKRHKKVETDWKEYNSSNKILQKKIKNNPKNYDKRIIHACNSITEMKCLEAHIQLTYYIKGEWNKLYNQMINLRINIR